jgi:nitrogen regulatory protein PII
MKEIKAYIQPFMLQKIITVLRRINIQGMSITEIKGAEGAMFMTHDVSMKIKERYKIA